MLDIATPTANVKPDDEQHTDGNARGRKYFADEIGKTWCKGAPNFIHCGQLLLDAKAELETGAFKVLIEKELAFDRSVGVKRMGIAANPILCAHAHNLPLAGLPFTSWLSSPTRSSKPSSPMAPFTPAWSARTR